MDYLYDYLTWVPNSLATPLPWNTCSCLPLPTTYSTQLIVQGLTFGVGQDWYNDQLFPRNVAKYEVMSGKTNANVIEERSNLESCDFLDFANVGFISHQKFLTSWYTNEEYVRR